MNEMNNNEQMDNQTNVYGQGAISFNEQPNTSNVYEITPQNNFINSNITEKKGLSITALVLGILSILACIFGPVCWVLGLVAIILGIIGKKRGAKGMGIAGIACGAVGLILSILIYGFAFFVFSSVYSDFSDFIKSNINENNELDIFNSEIYNSEKLEELYEI